MPCDGSSGSTRFREARKSAIIKSSNLLFIPVISSSQDPPSTLNWGYSAETLMECNYLPIPYS